MKVDIWMPLYVSDYISDTMDLTYGEHGIYLLLMMHYWKKKTLPKDIKKIQAISKTSDTDLPLVYSILADFFIEEDDKYYHKRLSLELEKAENRRIKASNAGKKGGRPRKSLEKTKEELGKSSSPSSSPSKKQSKHKYGEYKHVLLNDAQFVKLSADYGDDVRQEMITGLDEYLEQHQSKSYSNHNLTMRKWQGKPEEEKVEEPAEETEMDKLRALLDDPMYPERGKEEIRQKIKAMERSSNEILSDLFN